jgi:hypothetical protein
MGAEEGPDGFIDGGDLAFFQEDFEEVHGGSDAGMNAAGFLFGSGPCRRVAAV